jgi:hypothetical protein
MKFISAVLIAVIAIIAIRLASAPLYGRYSGAECREAYAKARTLRDSIRVDLHPYNGAADRTVHRCGEVRARIVDSPVGASGVPQPDEDL